MNKFIGVGRLTKEVELKSTGNGTSYVQNTIAIRNNFKNADGNYDSEFINIALWRNNAEFISKYGFKGCMVAIEGRLINRSYDKEDGSKGYISEVVVDNIELLSKKDEMKETEDTTEDEYEKLDDGTVKLEEEDYPWMV